MTVAALYVDPRGVYATATNVDAWDEARDARGYAGPHPVVAHPPCAAWCRWAHLRERDYGLPAGDDGGIFEAALAAVRTYGGVLEHPAHSAAWAHFGLTEPLLGASWMQSLDGSWVCEVDQAEWGLRAHKPTWLLYIGERAPVVLTGTHDARGAKRGAKDLSSTARRRTPETFAQALLTLASESRLA